MLPGAGLAAEAGGAGDGVFCCQPAAYGPAEGRDGDGCGVGDGNGSLLGAAAGRVLTEKRGNAAI